MIFEDVLAYEVPVYYNPRVIECNGYLLKCLNMMVFPDNPRCKFFGDYHNIRKLNKYNPMHIYLYEDNFPHIQKSNFDKLAAFETSFIKQVFWIIPRVNPTYATCPIQPVFELYEDYLLWKTLYNSVKERNLNIIASLLYNV